MSNTVILGQLFILHYVRNMCAGPEQIAGSVEKLIIKVNRSFISLLKERLVREMGEARDHNNGGQTHFHALSCF